MRVLALAAVVAACGSARPAVVREPRPAVAPAAEVGAIRAALGAQAEILDGGLWFADATCRLRFAKPRRVAQDELDGFATCLASLRWHASARGSMHDDSAVLVTEAGFEIEAHVAGGKLDFIGFSGRGAGVAETPVIAPETLETLRTAGEPHPMLAADVGAKLGKPPIVNALRVCLDEAGAVASIDPASRYGWNGAHAFTRAIADWKFRPFTVGDQPMAACAIVSFAYPADAHVVDRVPIPPTGGPQRISGRKNIQPTDLERGDMQVGRVFVAVFELCMDKQGVPTTVDIVEPSGVGTYDARVATIMKTWRYKPAVEGAPDPRCARIMYRFAHETGIEIIER